MKKTVIILLAAFVAAPQFVSADSLSKERKKEYKKKVKELTEGGWELLGSTRTIEVSLLTFYEALDNNENLQEITGLGTSNDKSVARNNALTNAQTVYSQQCSAQLEGRIKNDFASDGGYSGEDFNNLYGAFETCVKNEIKGELVGKFSIIRPCGTADNGRPNYEVQTFFQIDKDAASKARVRALENALRENAALKELDKQLLEYVEDDVILE